MCTLTLLLLSVTWLQAFQQLCIFVNDRLMTSTDAPLNSSYLPTILASEQTVLVLEASEMPVCYFVSGICRVSSRTFIFTLIAVWCGMCNVLITVCLFACL